MMKRTLAAVAAFAIAWSSAAAASPPYPNLKVIVQWAGLTQPLEVSHVGSLIQETDSSSPAPGSLKPITLERGLSRDLSFYIWATESASESDYRRDVTVTLLDQQNNPVTFFNLSDCWVKAYRAFSPIDSTGSSVTEELTLQCSRWVRHFPT